MDINKNYSILKMCEEALSSNPNNEKALNLKMNVLYNFKKYEDSKDIGYKILRINPNSLEVILLIANIWQKLKNYSNSLIEYENALKIDRNNKTALLGKANCLNYSEKIEEALEIFDKVLIENDNINYVLESKRNLEDPFVIIKNFQTNNEFDKCLNYLEHLDIDNFDKENKIKLLEERANMYDKLNNYEKAMNEYLNLTKINSKKSIYYINIGISLKKLNNFTEAINFINKGLEIKIKPKYILYKSLCFNKLERYEDSLKTINYGLKIYKKNYELSIFKLNLLEKLNKFESFKKKIYEMIKEFKNKEILWKKLVNYSNNEYEINQNIIFLQNQLKQNNPNYNLLYLYISELYNKLNDFNNSLKFINKVNINNYENKESLLYKKAKLAYNMELYDESIAIYDELIKFNPENTEYLFNIAIIYKKIGSYKNAIDYYCINPDIKNNIKEYLNFAFCLAKLDCFEESIKIYLNILQSYPENINAKKNMIFCREKLKEQKLQTNLNLIKEEEEEEEE